MKKSVSNFEEYIKKLNQNKYAKGGKVLMEISTHKAVKDEDKIKIYRKELEFDSNYNIVGEKLELLYLIPSENEDDLLPIFDDFEETNRILMAEANSELRMANGGETNYTKKWRAVYITLQGKRGTKEITLGRLSDKDDVRNALRRMSDLNIREVTLIEEIKEHGGYMAKGGETKAPNTYIPNKDVKELMVVLKNKMIKLKGDDILDGVYAKNSALKVDKKASKNMSAEELYTQLLDKAKDLKEDDVTSMKKEDIQKLLTAGYDAKDIEIIYFGVRVLEPSIDISYDGSGLLGYTEESIPRNIEQLVKAAKNNVYEIGLKYPQFNWKNIIKKYNISKEGKEIDGEEMKFGNETEYYVYTVFEGDKVAVGTSTNRVRYKDGKKQPEDDYYKKDPKELADFAGGYWGVVTSSKEKMYDIAKMILSQKDGYVKDMNLFVNRLGGIGARELDKNDIKYEHGGYMADGGDLASEFSIEEMKKHLDNEFPDSFGFKLFPIKNGTSFEPDYDAEIVKGRVTKGLSDYDLKPKKLMFPMYKRDHAINYNVTEGGENTYFDFLLSDTDGDKYYSGTFGFKDQGDVSPDYITKFIAFLMKSYGLPFKVNHSVYAKGGEVNKFDYMMLDRLRSDNEYYLGNGNRNPKNLWAGSVDGQIEEMKKLWNQLPKDKKPEWLSMEDIEDYERKMKGDKMAKGGETHRLDSIFEDGGEIAEGNLEMAMSNVKAIGHHAQELKGLLNEDTSIEAWVVAKLERAETDLSDVTHYIDGLKGEEVQSDTYFGRGGLTKEETLKVAEKYAEALSKSENKKFTVNTRTLEEDSFDLDMDGIEYDGGSYNIYDNGDVKNMALSGSPVYGKATYTVDEILRIQYSGSTKMADGGELGENGYVAFYKGKRMELYAKTQYEAQLKAAKAFGAKKSWDVNVVLAEVGGKQVVHNASFAKGGSIPNNYEGKTAEEVWSSWTLEQKNLFLEDHTAEIKRVSGNKSWHKSSARNESFDNLPQYVKDSVIDHVFTGQYAKGGSIPNNYEGKTAEEVWSSWTLEQKNLFLEDHTAEIKRVSGNKSWHKSSARTQTYDKLPQYVKDSVLDHVFTGQYADGGKLSKKSFFKKYEENEDENMHTENVVLLAENYGTESDIRDAKTILAKHESIGHLPTSLRQERDDLHDKLWSKYIQSREDGGMMAHGGKLKIGGDDFSFLLELSDDELSKRLDLVRKQQNINGEQYFAAINKKESTQKIEDSRKNLDNQEKAIIEARLIKYDKRHKMAKGGMMAKGGELTTYKILAKHKYDLQPKWKDEKLETGGREFLTFKQAQDFKKKLQGMTSSVEYKVVKVEYADGGMMAKGGRLSRKQKQLDLNKNGKLDSQDFKMLRAGRKNARKK
jgi:hypothetical protein